MKKHLLATLLSLTAAAALVAAPRAFDFKDPKGVNAIQFHLDSLLEPISGTAGGVAGSVNFDAENPGATTGTITVAANSLTVSNATMTEHLHSPMWLDVAAHPEIKFEVTSLSDVKTTGNDTAATAHGQFTLKGVTKEISVPVRLTYLAGALEKRTRPGNKGDLLVIRGEFTVNRGDYGIQPGKNEDKVNPEVKLTLGIVGSAPQA
jgi:polyisoprenoid-binding protein YceI